MSQDCHLSCRRGARRLRASTNSVVNVRALIGPGALLLGVALQSLACCEDTVWLTSPSGKGRQRVVGEIVEYTGRQLVLRRQGREERYDGQRVLEVSSRWSEPHAAAETLMREGRLTDALPLWRQALSAEQRPWARQKVLAGSVVCYRELGQIDVAGEMFHTLLQSDSATPYFDVIPLAWDNQVPPAAVESRAAGWLKHPMPAMRLLGASWLFTTPARRDALTTLSELATHDDPRVALLATAQQWRGEVPTVAATRVESWKSLIDRLPPALRGGPTYVLAQALARHQQHEQAAIAFMRLPILYPTHRRLVASSLLAAGQQLQQLQRDAEARAVYQELADGYPDTPEAAQATALLSAPSSSKSTP